MNIYCYNLVIFAISGLDSVYSQHLNNEKIKELEAEKNKLHSEIEVAIDDGLRALHEEAGRGGAGAGTGERYLTALKLHLQQATGGGSVNNGSSGGGPASNGSSGGRLASNGNRGEVASNVTGWQFAQRSVSHHTAVSNNTANATSLRRFVKKKKKKRGPDELDEIFVYKDVFDKKDIEPEQGKLMIENRLRLEKKLFEWMVKRQEEKKRLKEYLEKKRVHLLELVTEKCPRFGYGKRTTKKKTRRSDSLDEVDAYRKTHRSRPKYPCCRKCCKKSYLGCL